MQRGTATAPPAAGIVITPKVADVAHSMSAWAFDPVEMSIDVEWTITDPRGQVLWVKTIRGSATHNLGNMYTHKSNAKKRVDKVMEDLFSKSLAAITAAPELARVAQR